MIYVQVVNGAVVNRALFDGALPANWPDAESWVAHETAQIGWSYSNGAFTAPPVTADPAVAVPVLPPRLSYLQFRALFTAAENAGIMTAALSNHAILDWVLQAVGSEIDLTVASVATGLDALIGAGLLTSDRKAAILANQPPPQS